MRTGFLSTPTALIGTRRKMLETTNSVETLVGLDPALLTIHAWRDLVETLIMGTPALTPSDGRFYVLSDS